MSQNNGKLLSDNAMDDAFADVECMDYLIVGAIFSEPIDLSEIGCHFPPFSVNKDLNECCEGTVMILVGVRPDSSVAVHFKLKSDDAWECLTPKEHRDQICSRNIAASGSGRHVRPQDRKAAK